MKTITTLLAGAMIIIFCSVGKAQIIYSNNFSLGAAVNISNTPPTYAATYAGGSSSAVWLDVNGSGTTHGFLLANGIDNSVQDDFWALPFKPQTNHIYLLTVVLAFTNNPGPAAEFGYSINTTLTNYTGDARFNGSVNGYDWMGPNFSGNPELFAGNKTANPLANANNLFPAGVGTNTFQILLDTRGTTGVSNWVAAGCVDGVPVNGSFNYGSSSALYAQITNLTTVGISANGSETLPNSIQYQSFVLETTYKPFIIGEVNEGAIASGNGIWTNAVTVMADTNGGQLFYQWYANGAPLVNGVNGVSGANTNILTINPILSVNQATNYYVVVNNNYGYATSALTSVIVLTNPVVTIPATPSNSVTLFGGSGGNVGSSPTFAITVSGAPSLDSRWYTNGVQVGGATTINANSSSISFTNLSPTGPATFACVVSNGFGEVTNTWYATYIATPTAAYPQAVLSALPFDFWRLNETNNGSGNEGAISYDYQSGNNGIYTNVVLAQGGYNSAEPSETSAEIGTYLAQYSYDGRIHGADFAAPTGTNAEFTVEAWAQGFADNAGAPVVTEGTFNLNEEFGLGSSTNNLTFYQFYVRGANNTVYKAVSSVRSDDFNWHHLVGVCDQANGTVTLYVDGVVAATTNIPAGTGIIEASAPLTIGAGITSSQTDYGTTLEFEGYIDDVATYKYALSPGQVINHFASVPGNFVAVGFSPPPPLTTFAYQTNQALTIPIMADGSGPLGYYWTNVTAGGVIASGQTNVSGALNATLTIPNASAGLNGDQLELVVTNSGSSTNFFVTLFNPPGPITVDNTSSVLYSNLFLSSYSGGGWSINGQAPTVANVLVGGTNSVWIDALGTNDVGVLQANGTPTSTLQDSWTLPFQPHAGYVYTLSATETFHGAPSSWVALGFCQGIVTNGTVGGTARINGGTGSVNGLDWILWMQSGSPQYFGSGTLNLIGTATSVAGNVSHTISVILDTTGANWACHAVIDGNTTTAGTISPTNIINGITIAQNSTGLPNTNIQWNTLMLTQTAPGGVAPYLIPPLPPTNAITLTSAPVTFTNVTGYGTGPWGYYWINNSTVLTSGTTNNSALNSANFSMAGSSLNPGQLDLVLTNAFGTNITAISLLSSFPTVGTNITFGVTNGTLYLSWPLSYTGAQLQVQTNSLSAGIGTNWVNYNSTTTTNMVAIPINPGNGTVFFRFKH